MSTINRAVEVIDKWQCDNTSQGTPEHLAQALADAGLLSSGPPLPDPLFLAKATHVERGEGVVISHFPSGGEVRFFFRSDRAADGTSYRWVDTSDLAFHTPEIS